MEPRLNGLYPFTRLAPLYACQVLFTQ